MAAQAIPESSCRLASRLWGHACEGHRPVALRRAGQWELSVDWWPKRLFCHADLIGWVIWQSLPKTSPHYSLLLCLDLQYHITLDSLRQISRSFFSGTQERKIQRNITVRESKCTKHFFYMLASKSYTVAAVFQSKTRAYPSYFIHISPSFCCITQRTPWN